MTTPSSPFSDVFILIVVTAIISIGIGVLLVMWARSSNPVKAAKKKTALSDVDETMPEAGTGIGNIIFDEVHRYINSEVRSQEISRALSEVVSKEVERKLNLTAQELTQKYEKIVEQKAQNEDIAWQKYEKVLSQKKDTDAVIRSIAQGLVVVNSQGKVIMMNPAAEKLLGASKKEKIGKPILDNPREDQLISLVKDVPNKADREIELTSGQDETKKVLRASSAVIENENGQPIGMVSVLSDITKQKELDQLKATFVSNVSHELRTPLIAVGKSIALILTKTAGPITTEQEQFLTIADRNLKRLSRLINDLLDLSKLEAGKMQMNMVSGDLGAAITESIEGLINWIQSKSITVEKNIEQGLPQVRLDSDRIVQVLTNLIGNSIKFTPEQGTISVSAARCSDKEIIISVQDSGVGIAPENAAKVFDKFYQVGERVASDIHGTGIGLSIAREIVEFHGGRIWVESQKGQGAKFSFTIPVPA